MKENNDIVVSVCMITYNHELFISEAIDSIVTQKANFKFELVIGEDCSTDRTREICIEYKEKYPDIIRLLLPDKNLGMMPNFIETINSCKGKYIALCEGDDYWTDAHKLQKQVDLMEQYPDYSMSAHAASILMCEQFDEQKLDKSVLTLEDIIAEDWGIMTASILFRKDALDIPEWFSTIKNGDYGLQLLLSLKGNIGYLADNMCVYRQHFGGVSSTLKPLNQTAWIIYLLYTFDKYTNHKYGRIIKDRIKRVYKKQIYYAKGYSLRKAAAVLMIYQLLVPINPYFIKRLRK